MASTWETIHVDGQDMDVYLTMPDAAGPFPAVVVSQHGGGVDQFIREMADRLAAEGYVAIAPNLFHRYSEEMLADRSQRAQHMNDPAIIADVGAVISQCVDDRGHLDRLGPSPHHDEDSTGHPDLLTQVSRPFFFSASSSSRTCAICSETSPKPTSKKPSVSSSITR